MQKIKVSVLSILLACVWAVTACFAQNTVSFDFDRLTAENGLSQNTANAILQDSRGFVWIGTQDGLNLYDAYGFKQYNSFSQGKGALSDSYIKAISEDEKGNIWVAAQEGLNKYNRQTDNFSILFQSEIHRPTCLLPDGLNGLWVGTDGNGLIQVEDNSHLLTFVKDANIPGTLHANKIFSLHKDKNGRLLIGTDKGLSSMNPQKKTFARIGLDLGIGDVAINSIAEDNKGNLWLGTAGEGVFVLNPQASELLFKFANNPADELSLSNNLISKIMVEKDGSVWVGTANGLNCFLPGLNGFMRISADAADKKSLVSNRIKTLYKDKTGILWVGTEEGVNMWDPKKEKFNSINTRSKNFAPLNDNSVKAVYQSPDGSLWVGTENGGLNRLDREKGIAAYYLNKPSDTFSLSENHIRCIAGDSKGNVWVGTDNSGLCFLDTKTNKFKRHRVKIKGGGWLTSDKISSLLLDEDTLLWVGTDGGGLLKYNILSGRHQVFKHKTEDEVSIVSDFIAHIAKHGNSKLIISTYGGGAGLFDKATGKFDSFLKHSEGADKQGSNIVRSALSGSEGSIWLGTNAGFDKHAPDSLRLTQYIDQTGKRGNMVYGLLEDDKGNIWGSTNKGLFKFEKTSGGFHFFNAEDGLQGNQFGIGAFYKSPSGEMFFGGTGGLSFFYPEKIEENPLPPNVYITEFRLFNEQVKIYDEFSNPDSPLKKSILLTDTLILDYEQNHFSFDFTALSFRHAHKNAFLYKLENFDKEWIRTDHSRRIANYNLAPGEYLFTVKASNNDGVWNDTGRSIYIKIVPPIWQTFYFRLTLAVAVISLLLLIYRARVKSLERQSRHLEHIVEERTKELVNKQGEIQAKVMELAEQKEEIMQINDRLEFTNEALSSEKNKSDELLLNILPKATAAELKEKGKATVMHYPHASVLFTDFKGFTTIAEKLTPEELVNELDIFFVYFDKVVERHGLEKIKTIGDAYMCAGGIPDPNYTHPVDMVLAGLEIQRFMNKIKKERTEKGIPYWELRLGIHTGPLIAGVVGKKKFAYDIWGDTVNTGSRTESSGIPGKVNITENTYRLVSSFFVCEHRGKIPAKNKGELDMYLVEKIKPELSLNGDGLSPNHLFREKMKMELRDLVHSAFESAHKP